MDIRRQTTLVRLIMIGGLLLTLIGAGLGVYGVRLSPDEAIQIGIMRFNGNNREEDLKLPAVQNLLRQSNFAWYGFILIGVGTLVQMIGVMCDRR